MADTRKTKGPSACKRGLWGKKTKENNATMPHKPRLHALGPIVSLRVRHLWICLIVIFYLGILLLSFIHILISSAVNFETTDLGD